MAAARGPGDDAVGDEGGAAVAEGGGTDGSLAAPARSSSAASTRSFLVEPRLIRAIHRRRALVRGVALGLSMPHTHVLACSPDEILRALGIAGDPAKADEEPAELRTLIAHARGGKPLVLLPDDAADLSPNGRWRLSFHGAIHHAIEAGIAARTLSPAVLRSRLHTLGQAEIDEVRFVLRQESLLEASDDATLYGELVAVYLELWHFDREALRRVFPTLAETPEPLALFRKDLDDSALLAVTRPADATAPPAPTITTDGAPPPLPRSPKSTVKSTFLTTDRAAASDPDTGAAPDGATTAEGRQPAHWTQRLIHRVAEDGGHGALAAKWAEELERALGENRDAGPNGTPEARDAEAEAEAANALRILAERAAVSRWFDLSREARLLGELERAAPVDRRTIQTVDLVGFVRSGGQLAVVRPLPLAALTREKAHIARALTRLAKTSLRTSERALVTPVLRRWLRASNERLASAVRPRLETALTDVGLRPTDARTRTARHKLVEELVDAVQADGFFGLSQLRDALSRNDLPLPGQGVAKALFDRDPLLAMDRALTVSLDGVYRPGEVYLRALQKGSAVTFGTRPGRFLTLYLVLPALGAFVVLEGLQHVVGPLGRRLFHVHLHLLSLWSLLGLSAFLFALLHSLPFRRAVRSAASAFVKAISFLCVGLPRAIARTRPVRLVLASAPVRLLEQLVLKPLMLSSLVLLGAHRFGWTAAGIAGAILFVGCNVVLNTRSGRLWEERLADATRRALRHVGTELIPGAARAILDGFRRALEVIDRALYQITERLRVRRGDPRFVLAAKGVAGTVWFLVAYIVRLYVNVLIEPQVNPIKHFPVVTVSHKIVLPLSPTLLELFRTPLRPLGPVIANTVAGTTVLLLPGMFGFLVWELKANFQLYAANRSPTIEAALVGSHGETMLGFLLPGFHSGTVPKLYRKLRRAAWRDDPSVDTHRAGLHHVAEAVRRFIERELLTLVAELGVVARGEWTVDEHGVVVSGNRLRAEITRSGHEHEHERAAPHFSLAFEEQSGRLLVDLTDHGLLAELSDDQRGLLELALVGLYHRAGVSIVRQQLEAILSTAAADQPGSPTLEYDIADEGLVVWERDRPGTVVYRLDDASDPLRAATQRASLRRDAADSLGVGAAIGRTGRASHPPPGAWTVAVAAP
jgi:hypothetical protein